MGKKPCLQLQLLSQQFYAYLIVFAGFVHGRADIDNTPRIILPHGIHCHRHFHAWLQDGGICLGEGAVHLHAAAVHQAQHLGACGDNLSRLCLAIADNP